MNIGIVLSLDPNKNDNMKKKIFIIGNRKENFKRPFKNFLNKMKGHSFYYFNNYMTINELLKFEPDLIVTCTDEGKVIPIINGYPRQETYL